MTAHTPGPWNVYHAAAYYNGDEPGRLFMVEAAGNDDTWVQADADARLIAAAPDLLEVLREIMEYNGGATTALHDAYVMNRAHAAIAKAEGRS